MPRLISQNVSTGLDQNSAWSRGEPGHHRLMKSPALGHLAGDLAVVGLPGIPQAVAAREGDVEQQADGDHQQGDLRLAQAIEPAARGRRKRRSRGQGLRFDVNSNVRHEDASFTI